MNSASGTGVWQIEFVPFSTLYTLGRGFPAALAAFGTLVRCLTSSPCSSLSTVMLRLFFSYRMETVFFGSIFRVTLLVVDGEIFSRFLRRQAAFRQAHKRIVQFLLKQRFR